MSFADRLRKARTQKFNTAKDFVASINEAHQESGKEAFISYPAYAAYENGQREPRLEQLAAIAKHLNVSLDTLLDYNPKDSDYDIEQLLKKRLFGAEKLLDNEKNAQRDKDYFHIRTFSGSIMQINKDECRKIVVDAEKSCKEAIEVNLSGMLNEVRGRYSEEYSLNSISVISRAAAQGLGIDYDDFTEKIAKFYADHYAMNNPLNALAFYYFTGINPVDDVDVAKDLLASYLEFTEMGDGAYFPSKEYKEFAHYHLFEYMPGEKSADHPESANKQRLYFLEEYFSQINNIDYAKLTKKYASVTVYDIIRDMYMMMHSVIGEGGFYSFCEDPDDESSYYYRLYDVATPEGKKYFDATQEQMKEESED